mgnify:CR=1 FL=1
MVQHLESLQLGETEVLQADASQMPWLDFEQSCLRASFLQSKDAMDELKWMQSEMWIWELVLHSNQDLR